MDGNTLILITALIGALIIGFGSYFGSKKISDEENAEARRIAVADSIEANNRIDKLKGDLTREHAKNKAILDKIDSLQDKIDDTTIKIKEISEAVQNEQKEKGEIQLTAELVDYYVFEEGSNSEMVTKSELKKGYKVASQNGRISLEFQLVENKILVSGIIYDDYGNVVVEMNKGKWGLNKGYNFSINYDDKALEIINKKGQVNFQLELDGIYFRLSGFFCRENTYLLYSKDVNWMVVGDSTPEMLDALNQKANEIEKIFEHTGGDYLNSRTSKHKREKREMKKADILFEKKVTEKANEFKRLSNEKFIAQLRSVYQEYKNIYQKRRWMSKSQALNADENTKLSIPDVTKEISEKNLKLMSIALYRTVREMFPEFNDAPSTDFFFAHQISVHAVKDRLKEFLILIETEKYKKLIEKKVAEYSVLDKEILSIKIKKLDGEMNEIYKKWMNADSKLMLSDKNYHQKEYELSRDAIIEIQKKELFLEFIFLRDTMSSMGFVVNKKETTDAFLLYPSPNLHIIYRVSEELTKYLEIL